MEKKLLALVLAALLVSVGAGALILFVGEREEDPTDTALDNPDMLRISGAVDLLMSFVAAVALTGRLLYEARRGRRRAEDPRGDDDPRAYSEEDPLVAKRGI